MRSLDRHQVRLYHSHAEADDGGYMPGTPAERLSQVWELTKDAWALCSGGTCYRPFPICGSIRDRLVVLDEIAG